MLLIAALSVDGSVDATAARDDDNCGNNHGWYDFDDIVVELGRPALSLVITVPYQPKEDKGRCTKGVLLLDFLFIIIRFVKL